LARDFLEEGKGLTKDFRLPGSFLMDRRLRAQWLERLDQDWLNEPKERAAQSTFSRSIFNLQSGDFSEFLIK
jgi:hypothetical protein